MGATSQCRPIVSVLHTDTYSCDARSIRPARWPCPGVWHGPSVDGRRPGGEILNPRAA